MSEFLFPIQGVAPGPWYMVQPVAPATAPAGSLIGPNFQNGWANFILPDLTYNPLRYRIDRATKMVRIVGSISGGNFGSTAFTLPTAFRPVDDIVVLVASNDGSSALACQITASTGAVVPLAEITAPIAGTIQQLTSSGATITITNPTGPSTNIDLPTTGVSAGSYGDSGHVGTFTVDAEGRLSAASNVSITGGGVVAGADGWVTDTNTPTYVSATSFTAGAVDLTSVYSPGTRIKLTQTTVKYFVVTSSSFGAGTTTVNITGGTDYTLANAAIASPFYSYVLNPQGFPTWFNYNANATGFSATTSNVGRFTMQGRMCIVQIQVTGTSNAATFTCDLPVAPKTTGGYSVLLTNAGATVAGRMVPTAGSTSGAATFGASAGSAGGFTTSGTKGTTAVAGADNTPIAYEV